MSTALAAAKISSYVRLMYLYILESFDSHGWWIFRTGIPHLSFTEGSSSTNLFGLGNISPCEANVTRAPVHLRTSFLYSLPKPRMFFAFLSGRFLMRDEGSIWNPRTKSRFSSGRK